MLSAHMRAHCSCVKVTEQTRTAKMSPVLHPFTRAEWTTLKRCQRILRQWSEDECNGFIKQDDKGKFRRYHKDERGIPCLGGSLIADRRESAVERAREIAGKHGFSVYHQPDCRGCALHVYKAGGLRGRKIDQCYSTYGYPVE